MPGGCWVCNPLCGKCQPPALRVGMCTNCEKQTLFKREDVLLGKVLNCKWCGKDLTETVRPEPVMCAYSGLICAYPCGKSKNKETALDYQVCLRNTPPSLMANGGT